MTVILNATHSVCRLTDSNPNFRRLRWGWRSRGQAFASNYETRILFYDCFFDNDPRKILLVGPPPQNLRRAYDAATFRALPSQKVLPARRYESLSTSITCLDGVPEGTESISIEICGESFILSVNENFGTMFQDRAVLFTMSKNNDLGWISAWARYHVRRHRIDTIVLFDNGSTAYNSDALGQALSNIDGLETVILLSWPYAYGAHDNAVVFNPYWSQFLQVSAMSVALRRFAPKARALLNADIDEMIACPRQSTILDWVAKSRKGIVAMEGQWVEARPLANKSAPLVHSDFGFRLRDTKSRRCRARKWIIDPRRDWVSDLWVQPYMHWIENRPKFSKFNSEDVYYWHFKGINNNWKKDRSTSPQLPDDALEIDEYWLSQMNDCIEI